MHDPLLAECLSVSQSLLDKHRLQVPPSTVDMLAKAIKRARAPRSKGRKRKRSPTRAIASAERHAIWLLHYAEHPPKQDKTIGVHCRKLAEQLWSDVLVPVWLSLAKPSFDCTTFLRMMAEMPFAIARYAPELTRLLEAIQYVKSTAAKVGSPTAIATDIALAGCIAWKMAGHEIKPRWNAGEGKITGPLMSFLRDLAAKAPTPGGKRRIDLSDIAWRDVIKRLRIYLSRIDWQRLLRRESEEQLPP